MGSSTVIVRSTGNGKYEQEIIAGKHHLTADEPVSAGGNDSGPDPYSYLMAGLGACTAMTMKMYAERKGWPLEGVEVAVTHDKVSGNGGPIDRFRRGITIHGNALTEEQREELLKIADKCPVHKTLSGGSLIETIENRPSAGPSGPAAPQP